MLVRKTPHLGPPLMVQHNRVCKVSSRLLKETERKKTEKNSIRTIMLRASLQKMSLLLTGSLTTRRKLAI